MGVYIVYLLRKWTKQIMTKMKAKKTPIVESITLIKKVLANLFIEEIQ